MKKILSIILFIVYATTSSGATVSFHYCMGKLIGWDIAKDQSKNCDNCGMHKQEQQGCCNDAQASFNIGKEQVTSAYNFTLINYGEYVKDNSFAFIDLLLFSKNVIIQHIKNPPPKTNPPFLLNCVFRI